MLKAGAESKQSAVASSNALSNQSRGCSNLVPSFGSCVLSSPLVSVDRAKRIEIRRQEEEIFNATTNNQEELVRALNGPTALSGPGWPEDPSHPFPWAVIFAPCRLTKATIGNSSSDSSPLGCRSIITIFVFTDVPQPDATLKPPSFAPLNAPPRLHQWRTRRRRCAEENDLLALEISAEHRA